MACFSPIKGYRRIGGGLTFNPKESTGFSLQVSCRQCIGCRIARSKEWAVRCMHEASLHENNSFITLTYNPENLPPDEGLHHEDFQKFMKRLRKRLAPKKIRFYMCGEYGNSPDGRAGRPHFHAILFGVWFPDQVFWQKNKDGQELYRSKTLEKCWKKGFSTVGAVTFQSAAYVARYVMKKATGDLASEKYLKWDENGEAYYVTPDYNRCSLKPGVAAGWYEKYSTDVFPHDYVIVDGKKVKTPHYYLKLLEAADQDQYDLVKEKRKRSMKETRHNNTPERLQVRENIQKAKLRKLKRNLHDEA